MGCHAAVLDLDSHAPIDGHRPPAASPADISGSEDSLAHSLPISTVLAPRAKRRDNESSHELVQALSRREPTAGAKSSVSRRLCCRGPVYRARVHNPIDVGRGKEIDQDSTSFDPFLAVRRVNRLHAPSPSVTRVSAVWIGAAGSALPWSSCPFLHCCFARG